MNSKVRTLRILDHNSLQKSLKDTSIFLYVTCSLQIKAASVLAMGSINWAWICWDDLEVVGRKDRTGAIRINHIIKSFLLT